jgi:hypothetical protein
MCLLKIANIIFLTISAVFLAIDIVVYLWKVVLIDDEAYSIIIGVVLLVVIVYCLTIGFFFYSKLKSKILKNHPLVFNIKCFVYTRIYY